MMYTNLSAVALFVSVMLLNLHLNAKLLNLLFLVYSFFFRFIYFYGEIYLNDFEGKHFLPSILQLGEVFISEAFLGIREFSL